MNDQIDYDLSPDQWETLKALRAPVSRLPALSVFVLADLVAFGLAAMCNDLPPVITPKGRKVLVRGSSRLWDVAA